MIKRNKVVILSAILTLAISFTSNSFAMTPRQDAENKLKILESLPLKKFTPPKIDMITFKNGFKVYIIEDHETPTFNAQITLKTGNIYNPSDKTGLAGITFEVLRSGGSQNNPGDKLDDEMDFLAGNLSTSAGDEISSISVNVLQKDADRGLEILADIIKNPLFPQDKIILAQKKRFEAIRRQYDNPMVVGMQAFSKVLYGADSPWAKTSTMKTIDNIKREDLMAFHAKYFQPSIMSMSIAGDFKKDEMIAQLQKIFGDWQGQPVTFPVVPQVKNELNREVYYIDKDLKQSTILMGHLTAQRGNPDEYALNVMNYILGEDGIISRIGKEVRSNRGLAYSSGSAFMLGADKGMFMAYSQTRPDATIEAITVIQDIIKKMATNPEITDEELKSAKQAFVNKFIFNYENKFAIVIARSYFDTMGYSSDYLDKYVENIQKVTKDDVARVAKKYLHPDKLKLVVLGNQKGFEKSLSTLGDVKDYVLTKE